MPIDLGQAAVPQLAQPGRHLGPTEGLFDAFANALRDGVAEVAGGAAVNCRTAPALILRAIRGDRLLAQLHDEISPVVPLSASSVIDRDTSTMGSTGASRRQSLDMARGASSTAPTTSPLRFSIMRMAHEAQRRLLAGSFRVLCGTVGRRRRWSRRACRFPAARREKSRPPLRPRPGGSTEPSFGRKLFTLAHASSNVPVD